jgi:UDP-N-acetylglucosamine 1-carboxyvinyltransferase
MDKIVLKGGERITGAIRVGGAKNAALPIMAAALLAETPSVIGNIPRVSDIDTMAEILISLGAKVDFLDKNRVRIDPGGLIRHTAPYELVRKMRASVCLLGPLLGAVGSARISMPGGCAIGSRPLDLHIKGLSSLGASIKLSHGFIVAQGKRLRGAEVFLGGRFGSSVLATANVLMASVRAEGETRIESAACEPEIVDLAHYLSAMGARIDGIGSHSLIVQGEKRLKGVDYEIIPDRIETGTYMIAAAMTEGDIALHGTCARHLQAVIDKLRDAGVGIQVKGSSIKVQGVRKRRTIDVITLPYPGFPTDLQAQMMAFTTISPGISVITEKVFIERFMHVAELNRMAADISLEGSSAIVKGVRKLSGAPVMASDLRASAALVLAGLVADGETEINRVYHIDRGYEDIVGKLQSVGAVIERVA